MDERNIQNCLLKLSYLTLCLGSMRHSDSALINSAVIQWELYSLILISDDRNIHFTKVASFSQVNKIFGRYASSCFIAI